MIYCHVKVNKLRWFKFKRKPVTIEALKADPMFLAMLEFRKRVKAAAKEFSRKNGEDDLWLDT